MSEILLDFVDGLVGGDSEDGKITTEIDSWWSATNETETEAADDSFCSAPTEIFEDFTAEEFSNTRIIQWMHSIPPRFDHTKNVMNLMVGTDAQQQGLCIHTLPNLRAGVVLCCVVLCSMRMIWVAFVLFMSCSAHIYFSASSSLYQTTSRACLLRRLP
jgi:hypothetical protein